MVNVETGWRASTGDVNVLFLDAAPGRGRAVQRDEVRAFHSRVDTPRLRGT